MNRRHDPQYPNIFRKSPRLRSKKVPVFLRLTRHVNFSIGPGGNVYQRTAETNRDDRARHCIRRRTRPGYAIRLGQLSDTLSTQVLLLVCSITDLTLGVSG